MQRRVLGLCSGDPFSPRTFSGSVRELFRALERRGALEGAVDVDGGRSPSKLTWARAVLAARRLRGTALLARWSEPEIAARSARAARALDETPRATAALLYGTDFYPARDGESARVPVGAALDATFAQLARAAEGKFDALAPSETRACVERQRRVFDRCAWLFPRTRWCAESLVEDYGCPESRIHVTSAGGALEAEPPARAGYDGRTVLFVGRDWMRKGGPLVLDAFRIAHSARGDLRLRVVGPTGPPAVMPGVEWLGPLDGEARSRLPRLYSEASLVLAPSRFEAFGMSIVEAMAAGCPVVTLDRGAAREIVIDRVTGTRLRDAEPRALADAILTWLGDAAALERAGRAAMERVRAELNWDVAASRIVAAMESDAVTSAAPRGSAVA